MNIRRFVGASSREALQLVRDALGTGALVLSNKALEDGSVEIVALAESDLSSLSPEQQSATTLPPDAEAVVAPNTSTTADTSSVREFLPLMPLAVAGIASYQDNWDQDELSSGPDEEASQSGERENSAKTSTIVTTTGDDTESDFSLSLAVKTDRAAASSTIQQSADMAGTPPTARIAAPQMPETVHQETKITAPETQPPKQLASQAVISELASMREMMEAKFADLMLTERQRHSAVHATITRRLFAAGFSAQVVRLMVDNAPAVDDAEAAMNWVHSILEKNIPVMANEDSLMEKGGIFALVGPTGAGKTTTTAKLAARCVMRFGARKVALLTTDSYRIGAHEQLRIYGRILGVAVHAVKDGADLQLALSELRNKHFVLIDTAGMSQRDGMVADQIAMLTSSGLPVHRLLVLNTTSHGDTLNEVVAAYQSHPEGKPLDGCILTKIDEATHLGAALDTVLRYRLPIHYVSTGQKVPENLYAAASRFLIKQAFCMPHERSPFAPTEEEIAPLMTSLGKSRESGAYEVQFG